MITPRFELSQTDEDLNIIIYAPYVNKLGDSEVHVDENDFIFYSSPYYLRLSLPGKIKETDSSSGKYETDENRFVITLSKESPGEHFPNLDLLTTLLAPRKRKPFLGRPKIEIIDGSEQRNEESSDSEYDWHIEQQIPETESPIIGVNKVEYGFNNLFCNVFKSFEDELSKIIIDLPDPDSTPTLERANLQFENERAAFVEDHYLANLMEPEDVQSSLEYKPVWENIDQGEFAFTSEEQDQMKSIPRTEYLISEKQKLYIWNGLVDILCAYCYENRTTLGEFNSESAWTINKLSATLCWLREFETPEEAVKSFVRRSLCFPLFRNWELSMETLNDVKALFNAGKRHILRCLLHVQTIFSKSEPRYLLNKIFIDDYCSWIQQVEETNLISISEVSILKQDVELELEELESAAKMVVEEETETELRSISQELRSLCLSRNIPRSSSISLDASSEISVSSSEDIPYFSDHDDYEGQSSFSD